MSEDEVYPRPAGELLQPQRDDPAAIEQLKREIGSRVFAAQYQQNPTPPDGNMIKAAWLGRYDAVQQRDTFQRVVLSCDPAGKAEVIAGLNLPMLIKLASLRTRAPLEDAVAAAQEAGRKYISVASYVLAGEK